MPEVLPFRGLRYAQELTAVVCPPYDVIGPAEQRALYAADPHNVVRLELPLDAEGQPGSRYQQAAAAFRSWQVEGVLRQDARPAYYLHRTCFSANGQPAERRDVLAALTVEPWSSGQVLPHEHTMAGPKADRLALMQATHANLSPIWLLHTQQPQALARAWQWAESREPDAALEYAGEGHALWVLDDPEQVEAIRAAFAAGGPLYIADGHHRYETALGFKEGAGRGLAGAGQALVLLTWADDPGLVVLPTHRLLSTLPEGAAPSSVVRLWSYLFEAEPVSDPETLATQMAAEPVGPVFGVVAKDAAWLLRPRARQLDRTGMPSDHSDAWRDLDVAVLHALLLDPLLAKVSRPREEVLSFTRDPREALDSVQDDRAALAVLLNPPRVRQVLAVADAGDRMPEKSTYFFPKPPTGLVLRDLDDS